MLKFCVPHAETRELDAGWRDSEWENEMSKKRYASTPQEDYVTNRILTVFAFSFCVILGLMFAYKGYSSFTTLFITRNILLGAGVLSVLLVIAGVIWEYTSIKKGIDTRYKMFTGRSVAVGAAMLAVCAFCGAQFNIEGIKAMYVFVPAAAVLMLIYMIYSIDFFAIAAVSAAGGALMWIMSRSGRGYLALTATVVSLALLLLFVLLVLYVRKRGGTIEIGGKRLINAKNANYPLLFFTAGITAACAIVAYLTSATVAYYLIFVMFAYLFIMAVYYTVKLM